MVDIEFIRKKHFVEHWSIREMSRRKSVRGDGDGVGPLHLIGLRPPAARPAAVVIHEEGGIPDRGPASCASGEPLL